MTSRDGSETLRLFEYATHLRRGHDGLVLLGYDVEDVEIPFLSILHNCGYTIEQVREMAGSLNAHGLFDSDAEANRFIEAVKTDPRNPTSIPDHGKGVAVQIWGAA